MTQTLVDILEVSGPHQISVRDFSHREAYYRFQTELDVHCYEEWREGRLTTLPPAGVVPDQQCLVKLTTTWQRAVILHVHQVRDQVDHHSVVVVTPKLLSSFLISNFAP